MKDNGPLRSWNCKGCLNTHFEITPKGIFEYCTPMREGRHRKKWKGNYIVCLDKITEEDNGSH